MRRGVVALAALLAGCPASWGFRGAIRAKRDPGARLDAVALRPSTVSTDELVAIPGASVTCDGCDHAIAIEADGTFGVSLGMSYGTPKPIVLHVSAPGYETVDLDIERPGAVSQVGPPILLVVLRPKP